MGKGPEREHHLFQTNIECQLYFFLLGDPGSFVPLSHSSATFTVQKQYSCFSPSRVMPTSMRVFRCEEKEIGICRPREQQCGLCQAHRRGVAGVFVVSTRATGTHIQEGVFPQLPESHFPVVLTVSHVTAATSISTNVFNFCLLNPPREDK